MALAQLIYCLTSFRVGHCNAVIEVGHSVTTQKNELTVRCAYLHYYGFISSSLLCKSPYDVFCGQSSSSVFTQDLGLL